MRFFPLFLAILFLCRSVHAISTGNDRVTAISEHFEITVDRNKKSVLNEAAAWLENAYAIESAFFDYETRGKVQIVLLDEEDYSNGFAFPSNQWIVIYLAPARFQLRGTTEWFPNVSAHELSHILTLRKMGETSNFYGIRASVLWSGRKWLTDGDAAWLPQNIPTWLAEGLAQYGSMHCGFDTLDSHREMLLHEAWSSGSLLPLKMMETFSGDSRSSEMIYNQGYHLVDFIYRTYGREAVNAMMKAWDKRGYAGSFMEAFGISPQEVYDRWRKLLDVRLANRQPHSGSASAFGPSYIVEDAPIFDPATQTLYFLSSEANDFGITHLYAQRRGGGKSLIQRNVQAPIHLAPDGSLLYPAVRINSHTGARISDLYRYQPGIGSIEKLTNGLRVIAGVATESSRIYVITNDSGRTRIVGLENGRSSQWIDAPPGTEFMDLAPSGDTLLYVGATHGNNSDIWLLDARSGILRPLLASPHNERDPFVRNGRLYFSGDPDGKYGIYSLDGNTIYRHTPPLTPPAFAPFTDGTTLRYSAYSTLGFTLEAQSSDSSPPLAMLGKPSNSAFVPPPAVPLNLTGYDRTHIQPVEFDLILGYTHTLHVDRGAIFMNSAGDMSIYRTRINPCAHQGFAGGETYWSDPQTRNEFSAYAITGQCLDMSSSPYLPVAQVEYDNHNFTPDLFLRGQYQSVRINLPDVHPTPLGLYSIFDLIGGGVLHYSDYVANRLQFEFQKVTVDWNMGSGSSQSVEYKALDEVLAFGVIDDGKDFINQGVLGSLGGTVDLGGNNSVLHGNLEIHENVERVLFLEALGQGQNVIGDTDYTLATATLAGDLRIPMGFTLGSVGYRGLFLESAFLHGAFTVQWTHNLNEAILSLTEPASLYPGGFHSTSRKNDLLPAYVPPIPVSRLLELGLRFKTITPSSRVMLWNFSWQARPSNIRDGYFSASVSL